MREMRRSRQKGDNMRQTVATMNVPPRLLGLHISSGHLSGRASCRRGGGGGTDTAALKPGREGLLTVQADIPMQQKPKILQHLKRPVLLVAKNL